MKKANIMKNMKNLIGILAVAWCACALPWRASAAGDIIGIYPVDAEGNLRGMPVSSVSDPFWPTESQPMRFALRLRNANPGAGWRLHHTGTVYTEAADARDNPFRIGIYVSGDLRYATIDGREKQTDGYTDFFFSYDVKAGDLALPIVLAVKGSDDKATPANGSALSGSAYYTDPLLVQNDGTPVWTIDDSTATAAATRSAVLSFAADDGTLENTDYDLRSAGFFVKTLALDVPGTVPAYLPRTGVIRLDSAYESASTNLTKLYVWSMDETIVKVQGTETKSIHVSSPSATESRSVAVITLKKGQQDYTFSFKGGADAVVGQSATLVVSGFDDFHYTPVANERYADYLSATVTVTESKPCLQLTDENDSERVSIEATTDSSSYVRMKLSIGKPYDAGDVTVALKQQINGVDVPADEDYIANRYFAISTSTGFSPVTGTSLRELTVPAGETEVEFYVFALGSAAALKSPGLTLVPDVSAQPQTVRDFFALGASDQKNALLTITDQVPTVSATAPTDGVKGGTIDVDVTVADNWRDLNPELNTNGYRVAITLGGQTVLETNGVHFTEGDLQTFAVKLPQEGHPLKGVVKVWDATHETKPGQAEFNIEVEPALAATAVFYPDSDPTSTPHPDGYFFPEGSSPYFRVKLTQGATSDMYAFLVPVDEAASNYVACSACSNGLFIASGDLQSSAATLTFLDGFASSSPMRARFRVELRDQEQYDAPGSRNLGAGYETKMFELTCVNVSPTIVDGSMELNATPVNNKGTLMSRVPVGVEVRFRARVNDASPIDLEATGDKAIVTRWQFTDGTAENQRVYTRFATNVNNYVTCPYSFYEAGVKQTVTVWARDKDDLVERGDLDWGDPVYTFYVNVDEAPRVILSSPQDAAGTNTEFSIDENVAKTKGYLYVQLSEQPSDSSDSSLPISRNNPLVVELLTEAWGTGGFLALETNRVYFTNESGDRQKKVYYDLNSLDGAGINDETVYQVTARVITSTSSNVYNQAWSDYYVEGSVQITVLNVAPSIDSVKRTNGLALIEPEYGTNTWSAGETVALHWKISDVLPDITNGNLQVQWSIDPAADSPTLNPQTITNGWSYTTVGRKTVIEGDYVFNVPNVKGGKLQMLVTDGEDPSPFVREWHFEVEQTKDIKVNVFGPAATAQSKYKAALGLGQGTVGATGAAKKSSEGFVQTWTYAQTALSAELYAWGYPSKATWDAYVGTTSPSYGVYVDKGGIPAAVGSSADGIALGVSGNTWTSGPYYDWSTMGGLDTTAGDYDSYFYRWMVVKAATSGGGASAQTEIAAAPTTWPLATTRRAIDLDSGNSSGTGDGKDVTYGTVEVEAIFSRELYPKDNLGDINADGIPDKIVEAYGLGATNVGEMPEDDLTSLKDFNDDEDYLPNLSGSSYSTLIPGLPSTWSEGTKFTALLEIRGYHQGLNDAAQQIGVKNRLEADFYSDDVEKRKAARDYSELEMLAWSLTGYDKNWTPECPSDPTKADTDEDGFPDGYEYYFWYRAHVGDPEYFATTGKFRRLTGRRYDPKNPGRGTVITSEEIERLMNPQIAYGDGASANLIDSDEDGLPDLLELELGTNPFDFDTDGDGLPDGWEIMIAGLDPLTAQSYTDGKSDTERNTDGDAMAISSYKLEQTEKPVPVNIEHAKRVTFAVIDPNGDTDGVQWYAMRTSPTLDVKETFTEVGYKIVAEEDFPDEEFFSATAPTTVTDGATSRIAVACPVRRLVTYKPDETTDVQVCGYPYTLPVGTTVTVTPLAEGETVKSYKIAADVAAKDANACWIYGKGSARAEIGDVAETAAEYGCLALARQFGVSGGAEIAALPRDDRDVAFLHFLCYQEFGFDPRTAWCPNDPVAKRWGKSVDGEAVEGITVVGRGGYTGAPARTRAYANYDEFLVSSFFWNNEGGQPALVTPDTAKGATEMGLIWAALTTNPQGPNDAKKTSDDHYYGRDSVNGADTDGDGVPDGWELYVMAGPKTKDGAYVFAPPYAGFTPALAGAAMEKSWLSPFVDAAKTSDTNNQIYLGGQENDDGLNEFHEFEGTDSMNYYADYSTTIVHDVATDGEWKWFNKFFPTDPWSADTDGDGLSDGEEKKHFIYGTPEDDGTSRSIAGGGLNPCSVDTDCDGLPDGWEAQFAGTPGSVVEGEQSLGLRDGMDGTVKDAYTTPMNTTSGSSKEGRVNRDYDHDGLENWQEYLTGTMRCWRYDDPVSPLSYLSSGLYVFSTNAADEVVFDAAATAEKFQLADANEFWYKTLVDASSPIYNPHLVMDTSSGAQYFSRVTNVWDAAYLDVVLSGGKSTGAYYWFYDRVDGNLLKDTWGAAWAALVGDEVKNLSYVPKKYASCSPIDPDSDHDGMDDYYEVFHGMNPLLGESGREGRWWKVNGGGVRAESDILDLVYDSMYTSDEAKTVPQAWGEGKSRNFWQRKVDDASWTGKKPRGNDDYDFEIFPWLNGLATADPDGDGIRNQEESIMALVAPSTVWHHTDPTPLWMTDSSYSNSLVRMNYRLPTRGDVITPEEPSFTYEGQEYLFSDFDGFVEDAFQVFNPDAWDLVSSPRAVNNWIASFEENEGFDTDHDGLNDRDELSGKYKGETDPLDADSPQRRQAMYFGGPGSKSILQTMPFVREYHPETLNGGRYPDDLSFLQYTVECWVKAESLDDSTVIERAVNVGKSNPDDQEFIRCNFRIGLEGGKWYTLFDPNDTTTESVKVFADDAATTAWTHLAATYDAKELVFYVNGKVAGRQTSGLQPTYGSSAVVVTGENGLNTTTGMSYWRDREYSLHAIILGASVKTVAQGGTASALDVTRGVGLDAYTGFFKGYVDEVRIWDGARTALEVEETRMSRFTAADVAANREAFYVEWCRSGESDQYRGRYAKDGSGNAYVLPAELRFHWSFDSLFGAAAADAVAKAPAGFNIAGATNDFGRAKMSRPEGYAIDWWKTVREGYGAVYDDPAWICWVPNTVTHLPRYDGTTLDSVYWSEDFAGATAGTYTFARTAEPVSYWTQYRRRGLRESEIPYMTMSSRHHFVSEAAEASGSQLGTLFAFTGRHLNQTGDDMLALGGAFVKHVDDLWDSQGSSENWEIGKEMDGSGFPKWWRSLWDATYRINPTDVIGWDTLVKWPDQDGLIMTAGEAYLRDLARGYHGNGDDEPITDDSDGDFRQRYDLDGNGIPDWWEDLYGIRGESALDDHDNDGLCNIVEYMLSEKFEIRDALGKRVIFDPTRTCSVQSLVPDCFFRIGSLYVGEVFADYDFIEDWWERQYNSTYTSTLAYNTTTDNDDDGWSEFAEARYSQQVTPIVAEGKFHYDITSGAVADYPVPAVQLKVKYNGARAGDVESSSIAVRIGRDLSAAHSPDATYWIQGKKAVNASQSGSGVTDTSSSTSVTASNEYKRVIGKWSNRRVYGTLTPGFVKANSIRIQTAFDPSSVIYTWLYWPYAIGDVYYVGDWRYGRGTQEEYRRAVDKYGASNVVLLSSNDSFSTLQDLSVRTDSNTEVATLSFTGGKTFGTINLKTGEYDFDFGIFAGTYVTEGTNTSSVTSLEDQTYRIVYSVNPSTGLPRDLYLGEADSGYIREGANEIMVWADLDGDKAFTIGEPFGYVRDVDVGWRKRAVEVEIFDHSPILPRIDMLAASGSSGDVASDRGKSVTDYCDGLIRAVLEAEMMEEKRQKELEQLQWVYTNVWTGASLDVSALEQTRVRIVRWLVDGQPVYRLGVKPEVVLDQKMLLSNRAFLTEADILATGALDLDWEKLKADVVDNSMTAWYGCDVTNVAYLVAIGDGKVYWDAAVDTNSSPIILDRVIERRYGFEQAQAEVVSPKAEASVVLTARPTFKWSIPGEDDSAYTGYTAFQLQVLPVGSDTPVWDSGIRRLPPRDSLGRYVWTAPVYLGNELEKSVNYRWRVAVLNAKFPTADWRAADVGYFRMEPNGPGSDSGSIHACVRYFGPTDEVLKVGTVRVEAFASPDFTGDPEARASIAASEWAAIASAESNQVCQVELMGLPRGSYYVRAYIDSNEYGTPNVRDSWESWGYLCDRSGKVNTIYAPTAVTVDGSLVNKDVSVIYLEDTDVNGNRIPDAYEMHVNGGSLDNGTINLDKTLDCGLAITAGLVTNMTELAGLDDYTGLISHYADVLRTRGLVSLALGVPATAVSVDASGRIQVINRVESVKIESLAFDGDQLVLTVVPACGAADVNAGAAALYGVSVVGPKTVTCRIERTEALSSADWKEVATRTIGVGAGKTAFDVPKAAGASGFYRVVIEEK